MSFTPEQAASISEALLSTVEVFADTAPTLEDHEIEFGEISQGENATVRMMEVTIAGERFFMCAKRVGGERPGGS